MKTVLFSLAASVAVAAPVPQLIPQLLAPQSNFGCAGYFQLSGLTNTCSSIAQSAGITAAELAIFNPQILTTGCADVNAPLNLAGVNSLCAAQLTPAIASTESYENFNLLISAAGAPFDQQYLGFTNGLMTLGAAATSGFTLANFNLQNQQLLFNPTLSGISNIQSLAINPGAAQLAGVSNVAGVSNIAGLSNIAGYNNVAGLSNIAGLNGVAGISNIAANTGALDTAGVSDIAGLRNIASTQLNPGAANIAGVSDVAGLRNIAATQLNPGASNIAGVANVGGVAQNVQIASNPGAVHEAGTSDVGGVAQNAQVASSTGAYQAGGVTNLRSPIVARQVAAVNTNARASQINQVAANPGALQVSQVTDAGATQSLNTAWPMSIFGAENVFGLAPYSNLQTLALPYNTLTTGFGFANNYLTYNAMQQALVCASGTQYQFFWNTLGVSQSACTGQMYSVQYQLVQAAATAY